MGAPLASRRAWPGSLPRERAACGIGFVATPRAEAGHEVVRLALEALTRLQHRGGLDADGRSGDGAGVMLEIPREVFGAGTAVGSLFAWSATARERVEGSLTASGVAVLGWRAVPVQAEALGPRAAATMPECWQVVIDADASPESERRLYEARRRVENDAVARGERIYFASLSTRTLVYKGLLRATDLAAFYPDLRDPRWKSRFALFHQRYSTNTAPDWRLAQPFRFLAHNGEINTLSGNLAWMRAREAELPRELRPAVDDRGSDSSALDNALELLVRQRFELDEALATLVPDAWEGRADLDPQVRDFYRFQSTRFEPWDGPAALVFSDGLKVGAALDRNGLRPLRYQVTRDGVVVVASEAGVVPLDPPRVVDRGRLGPGQMLVVDLVDGDIRRDGAAKARIASLDDFGDLADRLLVPLEREAVEVPSIADLASRQLMHGWGAEDVKQVLEPMVKSGLEAVYSMGDDTPIAPLARTPRRVYSHLRQRFAQVTNPPIDSIRERYVMSLRTLLGARAQLLRPSREVEAPSLPTRPGPDADNPASWRGLLELESPILDERQLPAILDHAVVLDATFAHDHGLEHALLRLREEAVASTAPILVLSDRGTSPHRLPVPMPLAVGAVHNALVSAGMRMRRDLVAVAGDAVDVHDVAMLVAAGANAVHPYLAMATVQTLTDAPADARDGYRHALEHGLLKVMAKMGISCVQSYCGATLFEALGLGAAVMELCFPGAPSPVGGADFADLEVTLRTNHAAARAPVGEPARERALPDHGRVRFRKTGEWHAHNPLAVRALQKAARSGEPADYEAYLALLRSESPVTLRDLLELRTSRGAIPISDVEPAESILRRFVATAMSLGAVSPEVHEVLAEAMNRIGGRSNSGEGGEDPELYGCEPRRDNRIKQVASARFGVTPRYLERADELEIKIAQGSKPGEGGQLPARKVTELVARLRHAQEGVQLISPPPHHDIYSIEDLAQLIHDLREANPRARVGVKLVSEAGVGTIAAGVAKAGADYVLISGHEGGTGASPLSSIKQAGSPWELGLAETQRVLVRAALRDAVTLRVDGGLRNGRDVFVAALLGAQEFGFGTSLLVALGCDMARQCHLDTCPAGIATQRLDLRAKFDGRVEHVVNLLRFVAEEVRVLLASVALRSLAEAVGRHDLLSAAEGSLDLSALLSGDPYVPTPEPSPFTRHAPFARSTGSIDNGARSVGRHLSGRASFRGSAGQSFGAWCSAGTELTVEGEANDYVGKGMAGGVIAIRPPLEDGARAPVLAGNTCLYGATGGEVYLAGSAGERFGVRNSGAVAVLQGAGDHLCEYMTGGIVASLLPVGGNVGAGMTGGIAFLPGWAHLSEDVDAHRLSGEDATVLRRLLSEHHAWTGSRVAVALLDDWAQTLALFRKIVPRTQLAVAQTTVEEPSEPELVSQR